MHAPSMQISSGDSQNPAGFCGEHRKDDSFPGTGAGASPSDPHPQGAANSSKRKKIEIK